RHGRQPAGHGRPGQARGFHGARPRPDMLLAHTGERVDADGAAPCQPVRCRRWPRIADPGRAGTREPDTEIPAVAEPGMRGSLGDQPAEYELFRCRPAAVSGGDRLVSPDLVHACKDNRDYLCTPEGRMTG